MSRLSENADLRETDTSQTAAFLRRQRVTVVTVLTLLIGRRLTTELPAAL